MMKKNGIIVISIALIAALAACNKVRRSPGRAYMPDMSYSRAYETYYTSQEALQQKGIHYTARPVEGTVARGELFYYPYKNDSTGYIQSAGVKNPLNADSVNMVEAERLYLVNCGICHGAKLDGNGPLWKGGDGPYPVAPRNLMAADMKAMAEGTMFHSLTYGKGQMGSYASQLNSRQRWEVIAFIKSKQAGAGTDSTQKAAADTAKQGN